MGHRADRVTLVGDSMGDQAESKTLEKVTQLEVQRLAKILT